MVDMVEARKRAQRTLSEKTVAPEPDRGAAKPVLRSEPQIVEKTSEYFPVEIPISVPEVKAPQPEIVIQVPVPTETVPEDQIDFMQRLLLVQTDEEEAERLAENVQEPELEVLVFQLGDEQYGIEINQISEIIRFVEPTDVPNTVGFLDGIISLRGKMIPVVNGRRRLGHAPTQTQRKTRIIVLNENGDNLGILVDAASQVIRLPEKSIEPTPSVVNGVDAEFIQGVCEHQSQLIILLNLERFLRFKD